MCPVRARKIEAKGRDTCARGACGAANKSVANAPYDPSISTQSDPLPRGPRASCCTHKHTFPIQSQIVLIQLHMANQAYGI